MRPLFSIHAGEFLVGNEIERRFPAATLWLPAKDTGVDLLVTNGPKSPFCDDPSQVLSHIFESEVERDHLVQVEADETST
jgi:hypothetical protein